MSGLPAPAPVPLRRWPLLLFALLFALLFSACATPPLPPLADAQPVPARYKAAAPDQAVAAAESPVTGWSVFADPALDALMTQALKANPQIEMAVARLQLARAAVRGEQAAHRPQLALNASGGRQGGPLLNAAGSQGTLLTAGLSVAWEADFFGRLSQAEEAARWDARSRAAAWQAARLLVQAEVAQAHLMLRALDAESAIARQSLQAQHESLRLTEQRWQRGALPETAVLRERADEAAAQADVVALASRRAALVNGLAVLLGENASGFSVPALGPADPLDAAALAESLASLPPLPTVPAGLPSELLARRPDVATAVHAEAAARARSGAARAAWWPSFSLTASGGHASASLADLVQVGARAWGLGLLTSLPLFDGGRREAGTAQADAALQLAGAERRALVLQAFREVEDHLTAVQSLAEQQRWQAQASAALRRSRELAESRQRQGLASPLVVLAARRAELQALRTGLQGRAAQVQATVGLIKALGGDWMPVERQVAAVNAD